jgi:seryl-tRNA(Sec) selenium transferase
MTSLHAAIATLVALGAALYWYERKQKQAEMKKALRLVINNDVEEAKRELKRLAEFSKDKETEARNAYEAYNRDYRSNRSGNKPDGSDGGPTVSP